MQPALHCDFETRSILDLKAVGLWNYARHPSTDVWCMAYAQGDAEPSMWLPGQKLSDYFVQYIEQGGKVVAHNAAFELAIWNEIMVPRYRWPRLSPEQTYCTMAQAYAMGLPGGLEDAALALGLSALKDAEGRQLMLRMARPRRMEGDTPIWWDEPEKLARLYAYCQQDVRVEREIEKRVVALSPHERKIWCMDFAINQRGVAVDIPTAKAGVTMVEQIKERAGLELTALTDGEVSAPSALIPMKQWLAKNGVPAAELGLDKGLVTAYLDGKTEIPPKARRVLEIRQESGKASVAKLDRMIELAGSDGRIHNIVQYHGAAPGRWAARGVQVHNLIREMPPAKVVDEILGHVRDGALDWIGMAYGPPMQQISSCLRSFFVAPPGKKLIAGDFSGVESRCAAWFVNEAWKIRAFTDSDAKKGPGVYELTASKTLGIPVESIGPYSVERQIGKVEELAFQYQGGVAAARKFLPPRLKDTPEKTLNQWKLGWRAGHPMIVGGWKALQQAAIAAVQNEGQIFKAGYAERGVQFRKAGSFLWCRLPSGRVLCYPYPKILAGAYGDELTYMTVPNEGSGTKIIEDVKNANNWSRVSTYGGSLMQTTMEAICRDLLADKMLELTEKGAQIVLHVHDEVVIEVSSAAQEGARAAMQTVMCSPSPWAAGFPLKTTCKIMDRYGKT